MNRVFQQRWIQHKAIVHVTQKVTKKKKKRSGRSSIKQLTCPLAERHWTHLSQYHGQHSRRETQENYKSHDLPPNTVPSSFLMTFKDPAIRWFANSDNMMSTCEKASTVKNTIKGHKNIIKEFITDTTFPTGWGNSAFHQAESWSRCESRRSPSVESGWKHRTLKSTSSIRFGIVVLFTASTKRQPQYTWLNVVRPEMSRPLWLNSA